MEWTVDHSVLTGRALVAVGIMLLICIGIWLEFRDLSGPGPSFPIGFQPPA